MKEQSDTCAYLYLNINLLELNVIKVLVTGYKLYMINTYSNGQLKQKISNIPESFITQH